MMANLHRAEAAEVIFKRTKIKYKKAAEGTRKKQDLFKIIMRNKYIVEQAYRNINLLKIKIDKRGAGPPDPPHG